MSDCVTTYSGQLIYLIESLERLTLAVPVALKDNSRAAHVHWRNAQQIKKQVEFFAQSRISLLHRFNQGRVDFLVNQYRSFWEVEHIRSERYFHALDIFYKLFLLHLHLVLPVA